VALVHELERLSYAELNERGNQLARQLLERGVGPGALVALCMERSVELVVAVLGVLKAGGAYAPLDPSYPVERLRYMLQDAAPKVVVTQQRLRAVLDAVGTTAPMLAIESADIANEDRSDLVRPMSRSAQQLAYVIYTSGSTGRPKGVMVEHESVVNLWRGLEQLYCKTADCRRIALNASLTFDASVQQLVQLLSGRTLYLVPDPCRRDAERMLAFMAEHGIDAVDCTPSQLRAWLHAGLPGRGVRPRVVLVGGEPIDAHLWNSLARCEGTSFYNLYGPTECTVDATFATVQPHASEPHVGP
jgi:amino acid adenylation domain-containing protein